MKVSVIGPVKNESQFIGYSIMAVLPYVHEIVYAVANSEDGTEIILDYIKDKYAKEKLIILKNKSFDFDVKDMKAYNDAFNVCIERSTGDAVWFLHPDMLVMNPEKIADLKEGPVAWTCRMRSFAGDFQTEITQGRAKAWKNMHVKKMGLHYYGGYGSQNEDFYHLEITGKAYKHYGEQFDLYPYFVSDSGINIHHFCEMKPYKRRFEKMVNCLRTLSNNNSDEEGLKQLARNHPRVCLSSEFTDFGKFEFSKTNCPLPDIISKYEKEFTDVLKGEAVQV